MNKRLIYLIGLALLLFSPIRIIADDYVTYQYWIDNDIGNAHQDVATSGTAFNLEINAASQSSGVHYLNVRAMTGSVWGTVIEIVILFLGALFAKPFAHAMRNSQYSGPFFIFSIVISIAVVIYFLYQVVCYFKKHK